MLLSSVATVSELATKQHEHRQRPSKCRTQPQREQVRKEAGARPANRRFCSCLLDSGHHSLSENWSWILALQGIAKIVFRKMHNVTLQLFGSASCAALRASGAACSSRCLPASA